MSIVAGIKGAMRRRRLASRLRRERPVLRVPGHCPTCDRDVDFVAFDAWLRDHLVCSHCASLPRERALMRTIDEVVPDWRRVLVHESSPNLRGASAKLSRRCERYVPSQFFTADSPSTARRRWRHEDLEALTFADGSVDLHVTQDVIEHLFDPEKAFAEIARTLRPGGHHIFTVPLVRGAEPTRRRASRGVGGIVHHLPAEYHGNPVDRSGVLVTVDWGRDIVDVIRAASGMTSRIVDGRSERAGILGELTEVVVSTKPVG